MFIVFVYEIGDRMLQDSSRAAEIFYPESDGRPVAETPEHFEWMMRLYLLLHHRYRDEPRMLIYCNLMVYFVEGDNRRSFSPDLIVLPNGEPRKRRVLKLWEEPPAVFVLETTSVSTKREDLRFKYELYQQLGIQEYFLYDPTGEYLRPKLQGYRLDAEQKYQRLEFDGAGRLASQSLGLTLELEDDKLVLRDAVTHERLLTGEEDARRHAELASVQVAQESRRAAEAEARIAELEAELRRAR